MGHRVLLVEDEARMREVVTDYYTAKGCAMDTVEKLALGRYDLVLLDIMLPGLDGFAVCREIWKDSVLPVIFLTARGSENRRLTLRLAVVFLAVYLVTMTMVTVIQCRIAGRGADALHAAP